MLKNKKRKFGLLDLRKDPEDIRDRKFLTTVKNYRTLRDLLRSLPNRVDHANDMSPVKDQGLLGSCVSFATSAMKEWQEMKEHKEEVEAGKYDHRDSRYYDFSEAWIYWNCKKIDVWPDKEGTSIRYAMKVLQKIGVPCERAWPYDDKVYGEPKEWAKLIALWGLIGSYYRIDSLQELKVALVDGPVPIGVGVFESMFYPGPSGIIDMPREDEPSMGGHAVCACGYDESYIKFKNSWSPDWGDNGYGYLSNDYIDSYMWDAWAARDLNVTKEMLEETKKLV